MIKYMLKMLRLRLLTIYLMDVQRKMTKKLTTISQFSESLKISMQKYMNSFLEKYIVPFEKFNTSIKNGQIVKKDDKFWITGFEDKIEVVCDLFSDTPKFKSIFDNLVMKCIATGDQNLWNHLYPHIKKIEYEIDRNVLLYFNSKVDEFINDTIPTEITRKNVDKMMENI